MTPPNPSRTAARFGKGQVALVTGAGNGIGYAISQALVERGMHVVLTDIDDQALAAASEKLRPLAGTFQTEVLDVADPDAVERVAVTVFGVHGRLDLVLSNAGIADLAANLPWEESVQMWRRIYDVNLFGLVHMMRSFLSRMVQQQHPSTFAATASEQGLIADLDSAVYGSSKHAVVRIMEGVHLHLRDQASLVNAVLLCPGLTATSIASGRAIAGFDADTRQALEPMARAVADSDAPGDVAAAFVDSVANGIFYCITASGIDSGIEHRVRQQIARANPVLRPADVYCGVCAKVRVGDACGCDRQSRRAGIGRR